MKRKAISEAVEEQNEIDLTPMLDVVFIMLIFFIVTANFVKEPGLEVSRPEAETSVQQENAGILVAIGPSGEVYMDGRRIDVRQVKANVLKLRSERPDAAVVIRADRNSTADIITEVMDGIRAAGVRDISLAADQI